MGSMEQGKKMKEDYTKGIGILRSEFGRLRGSAKAFAIAQATKLLALNTGIKKMEEELSSVWVTLTELQTLVIASFATPRPQPVPTPPPRPQLVPTPTQPFAHPR